MNRHFLLGTAGHIDHGKTALIKALTGTDTDRLPEEKLRGITVDLGFASLQIDDLTIGIVDVPGHERLLKNMLAGATGVDLALLVVAADESVMPQTREHFEVLRFLRLTAGVIALTKCDMVEEKWIDLVADEVSELVAGSFLEVAPQVRVSAKSGRGLDDLRSALRSAADRVEAKDSGGPFRMSVDRSFTAPGHGAVVTGSVSSGRIAVGDSLELMPQGVTVQVRGLESHAQKVDTVQRGQRAAVNLAGIHYRDIQRGQTLASPASLALSKLVSLYFEASALLARPIKSRTAVRFYAGTAEHLGELRLLDTEELYPGQCAVAQVELRDETCVVWGQPLVVRALTAHALLGGGRVVDPLAYRIKRKDQARVKHVYTLAAGDEQDRVAALAFLAGSRRWDMCELSQRVGVVHGDDVIERLVSSGVLRRYECRGQCRLLHRDVAIQIEDRLLDRLADEHQALPLKPEVPLGRLRQYFTRLQPPEFLDAIARHIAQQRRIQLTADGVALADWRPRLTTRQAEMQGEMISVCRQAGLTPPTVGEFALQFGIAADEIDALLLAAVDAGTLVYLPDKETKDADATRRARIFLHRDREREFLERAFTTMADSAPWTVSEFREVFGISRKYAVPLCEHLDHVGLTERQGDRRHLKQRAEMTT